MAYNGIADGRRHENVRYLTYLAIVHVHLAPSHHIVHVVATAKVVHIVHELLLVTLNV